MARPCFLDSGKESERHGKQTYDLNGSGLDLIAERARFTQYQEAYAIPKEVHANDH